MTQNKKKIFPKAQKKFQKFLTDESGKITKKGALGISAGAALLSAFDNVDAATYHLNTAVDQTHSSHSSATHSSHCNGKDCFHSSGPGPNVHGNITYGTFENMVVDYDPGSGCTSNHASGIVNGHANVNPSANWSPTAVNGITGHASHVSHANHGSGGWC